jgi:tetratricopeptide (TPR) repeat protein
MSPELIKKQLIVALLAMTFASASSAQSPSSPPVVSSTKEDVVKEAPVESSNHPSLVPIKSTDDDAIRAKLELGMEQRRTHKFKEAEDTFKDAIRLSAGADKVLQAKAAEALAGLYLATNRLEESQSLYSKAIGLLEGLDKPLALAVAYDNMSNVCLARHKLDDAEGYNKKALAIFEKAPDASKIDLAKSLNQMALIALNSNKYQEAEAAFKKTIALYPAPAGTDQQTLVATVQDNLGGVYLKTNQFTEAETARKKALALFEKAGGPKSIDTAKCLQNLAAVYGHQKKYEEALPYVKRAEAIDEATFGLRSRTTLAALNSYVMLLKLAHHDKELQELAARIKSSAPPGTHEGH